MTPELIGRLAAHRPRIAELCREFGVTSLALFGSGARDDWRPDGSDLDFVVTFASPSAPGIADRYFALADALEQLLGRPIDLITDASIRNPYFRKAVDQHRIELYAA